eukprot:1187878-Prorocentrum_minimum.AAC.8
MPSCLGTGRVKEYSLRAAPSRARPPRRGPGKGIFPPGRNGRRCQTALFQDARLLTQARAEAEEEARRAVERAQKAKGVAEAAIRCVPEGVRGGSQQAHSRLTAGSQQAHSRLTGGEGGEGRSLGDAGRKGRG